MRNLYQILEVSPRATPGEIKSAFRKLARLLHPDRDPGNPDGEERFKEVVRAYEVLSDAEARGRYDRGGHGGHGGHAGFAGRGGRASSGYAKKGPRGGRPGPRVNGANVTYTLEVSFREAALGAGKHIGTTDGRRLKVTVPPGTRPGQILRLKGQGTDGIGGGTDGDAHVEIVVAPDPVFRQADGNVHLEVPVTLQEAVLGGKIEVPTLDGPVNVTVPGHSNTGTVLRLRGKGIADGSGGRGDQLVTLKVVLPADADEELTDFVRRWGPNKAYEVRRKDPSAS